MVNILDFPEHEFVFSQSQLARIAGTQRTTINRRIHALIKEADCSKTEFSKKRYGISFTRKVLSFYFENKRKGIKNKVNMFYNFKGGTGKTTICYQLSTTLTCLGFNVLVIDCDPQAHLTSLFGLPENHDLPTIYDVMINGLPIHQTIVNVYEGLDLIPSAIPLTKIEMPLAQKMQRESILSRMMQGSLSKYDFIMIDANPAFSLLNLNILMASNQLNVVCETQPFSLSGLTQMVEELEKVFAELKRKLVYHVIPNKFESKTAAAQEVLGALRRDYREETTQSIIRKCEDINISTKRRLPALYFSGKNSSATEDLLDLTNEFLDLASGQKASTKAIAA